MNDAVQALSPRLGQAQKEAAAAEAKIQAAAVAPQATEDEKRAASAERKDERAEELEKAVDGIYRDFWLESPAAKILAIIAFALLCVFLFWQGLQQTPRGPAN